MGSLLQKEAAPKHLYSFFVGKSTLCKDYIHLRGSARKSMQVQIWILCCPSLCCLASLCAHWCDHHTFWQRSRPLWECRGCLSLDVLHILKCLFVSLLEGLWDKKDRWGVLGCEACQSSAFTCFYVAHMRAEWRKKSQDKAWKLHYAAAPHHSESPELTMLLTVTDMFLS